MTRLALTLAALMMAGSAQADDLDRAADICMFHMLPMSTCDATFSFHRHCTFTFEPGWESCGAIIAAHDKRQNDLEDAADAERRKHDPEDQKFINDFAKTLSK
jgi:hypothetical protein